VCFTASPVLPLALVPMESDAEEAAAAVDPGAGRLKGSPELTVDADMREVAKRAAWSVSSFKDGNGVASLRDDNLDAYWQSVAIAHHHFFFVFFQGY
jgi:anaphase-promoting complex subunit 10